jgi:hypothetical protein
MQSNLNGGSGLQSKLRKQRFDAIKFERRQRFAKQTAKAKI